MLFIGQMCTCYFFCFLLLQIPIFLHKIIPSPCHSPPVIFHKILGRIVRCVVLQMGSLTIGYATTKYAACRVMLQLGFTVAMCKYTYIYIYTYYQIVISHLKPLRGPRPLPFGSPIFFRNSPFKLDHMNLPCNCLNNSSLFFPPKKNVIHKYSIYIYTEWFISCQLC